MPDIIDVFREFQSIFSTHTDPVSAQPAHLTAETIRDAFEMINRMPIRAPELILSPRDARVLAAYTAEYAYISSRIRAGLSLNEEGPSDDPSERGD